MSFPSLQAPAEALPPAAVLAALEDILSSATFRKAPSLRHLLRYIVTNTVEGNGEQIKESTLALDVFARSGDFDGRVDNIVRVQAHRLRKLLETYYADEGRNTTLGISIPKGSYVGQFEMREELATVPASVRSTPAGRVSITTEATVEPQLPGQTGPPGDRTYPLPWRWIAAAFVSGITLTAVTFWAGVLPRLVAAANIPASVRTIWGPVFDSGVKVIASYSNPAFLRFGSSSMLLRYDGPLSAPHGALIDLGAANPYVDTRLIPKGEEVHFSDSWTGTGEVLAMNRLTLLSSDFRHSMSVTPSRLLSLSEMHGANVIFVGGPTVNGALAQVGLDGRPIYTSEEGRITVRNPRAGEPQSFSVVENPVTRETMATYTVFSVLPGIDAGHTVVSSAGNNTAGTWAGIDFATSTTGADQLVRTLKAANGGNFPRHYQAVIRSEILKGATSNPSLVTVRVVQERQ